MKKFLVFLCAAVTALSSLAFSACGFSACSNSDYGRQLRAIKRIAADESYSLCTYEYINGESVCETVKNSMRFTRKNSNVSDISYYQLIGDKFYFIYNYYSTFKDEDYEGEGYKDYLLGYINCKDGRVNKLDFAERILTDASYENNCRFFKWADDLVYKAGERYFLIDGESSQIQPIDIGSPQLFYPYSSEKYLVMCYDGEYKAWDKGLNQTDLGVLASEFNFIRQAGVYAFFKNDGVETPCLAVNIEDGTREEGVRAEGLYNSFVRGNSFCLDGKDYEYEIASGKIAFTCGETVTEVLLGDLYARSEALEKVREIYNKTLLFKQVYVENNEVLFVLNNPKEYEWVLLPNLFGYGVEYTVSVVVKYDILSGECKYAGYYPGDGTLIKLYKR